MKGDLLFGIVIALGILAAVVICGAIYLNTEERVQRAWSECAAIKDAHGRASTPVITMGGNYTCVFDAGLVLDK
jgi:uncharacterized membrane protein YciS (DUF1049 family)